jgi:uncharacterized membrane protein
MRINSLDASEKVRYLPEMLIDGELLLCGSAGLLLSTYVTLVYFRLMSPSAQFVPRVCRLGEETCERVLRSTGGRLLGLPNSLFGMGYYGSILVYALAGPWQAPLHHTVLAASIAAILYSTYLVSLLLLKLRADCAVCYTCHALNAAIVLVLIFRNV